MCGIFLAIPKDNYQINHKSCKVALDYLKKRGPDWHFTSLEKRKFFGQTILSMTGTKVGKKEFHVSNNKRYLILFNGEIYNYKRIAKKYNINLKETHSDTYVLINSFNSNNVINFFSELDGMFSIIIYDRFKDKVFVARDTQGEKTLHFYEDKNCILISSEINAIKIYLNKSKLSYYWLQTYLNTRHFLQLDKTIYKNIKIIEPGEILEIKSNFKINKLDKINIHDLISEKIYYQNIKRNESDLVDELDYILKKNIKEMIPYKRNFCSILSGGVDSSLVSYYLSKISKPQSYISINHVGKDKISNQIGHFKKYFGNNIKSLKVNEKQYYENLIESLKICSSPINSHDFPGKLILAREAKLLGSKAIFGGDGADELFGGYETYRKKINKLKENNSDYSKYFKNKIKFSDSRDFFKIQLLNRWNKCLDAYHFLKNSEEKNRLAMMLNDSSIQLSSVGLRGCDLMFMNYSIESRSLFLRKDVIKFALNLPLKFKINLNKKKGLGTKIILKKLFIKYFSKKLLLPKQGFSGFPNETKSRLGDPKKFRINRIIKNNKNDLIKLQKSKEVEWKITNLEYFLRLNSNDI